MMKKTMLFATALFSCAVFAGEVYKAETSDLYPPKSFQFKDGVFRAPGARVWVNSKKVLAVDPAKKYVISGEFRFLGTLPKSFSVGFMPMTEKGRAIPSAGIHAVPETGTVLAAEAKAGDTVIKVADAAKWNNKLPVCAVVFDAKEDFSDIPNYTFAATKKGSVKKNGDAWEIELVKPLAKAYAAGTPVRQHLYGGTYIYAVSMYGKFSADWRKYSGTVTGMTRNVRSDKQFWPATAKVRMVILTSGGKEDSVLEFRDFKVEELP
ncbi:MAG: hypothetical protein IJS01_01570 [Lentisphaeria bacterium]|nr:hypothetical protein [Lentisphaeria bacterium]